MSNIDKINELRSQITDLEEQDRGVAREAVLPLLRSDKYKISATNSMQFSVVCGPADHNILTKAMDKALGDSWSYHMDIELMESVHLRYDDGTLTLRFCFPGGVKEYPDKVAQAFKQLQLKCDCSGRIAFLQKEIAKYEEDIKNAQEIQRKINE